MSNNSSKVEYKLRRSGFKVLLAFSILISAIIIIAKPNNVYIAWLIASSWFVLAATALWKPRFSEFCAKTWVLVSIPIIPFLILTNGIIPATLISLATLFPVMLVKGLWRLIAIVTIASSTLLVPFSNVPYDTAIWLRLSVSNAIVAAIVLSLVTYLEQALLESLDKSDDLKKALLGERKASEAQSKFLANMSHEIRTPMNGILGLLDVVLAAELTEQQRSHLKKIKYSGEVLHRILNDILDYSKLSAGKLLIEEVAINIPEIVTASSSFFQAQVQKKGIALTYSIDDKLENSLIGDPTRITQVITNLLDNAVKFTEKGKVNISVDVTKQSESEQSLEFCISDSGVGIPKESLDNIFSAFTQADDSTSRRFGGTGLGLQIAKNLIEQMGGEIWVESTEGEGSKFFFTLSLAMSSKLPSENSKAVDTSKPQYSGRVLVVEDNYINQVVAQEILLSFGLEVDLADDGQKCIDALKNTEYDLILMDLHMPNVDGFEACSIIRKTKPDLPVVALTAAVLKDEVQKALDVGMNSHLAKPIDQDELTKVLSRHLNRQV
ncbi:MAG: signal transduction histidine kinase/CheY-like chemotaxis protein [Glaciecola sp.]|jgi:signal transduction histidine kinase/CheY-like chemotaxis protein